mmetsp:Transcript_25959/g.42271  ORF Transcript_25959/g.42271 Transcript_25959/m.42271 type:complete len:241 (+) Transcript_25959:42-764(+)
MAKYAYHRVQIEGDRAQAVVKYSKWAGLAVIACLLISAVSVQKSGGSIRGAAYLPQLDENESIILNVAPPMTDGPTEIGHPIVRYEDMEEEEPLLAPENDPTVQSILKIAMPLTDGPTEIGHPPLRDENENIEIPYPTEDDVLDEEALAIIAAEEAEKEARLAERAARDAEQYARKVQQAHAKGFDDVDAYIAWKSSSKPKAEEEAPQEDEQVIEEVVQEEEEVHLAPEDVFASFGFRKK